MAVEEERDGNGKGKRKTSVKKSGKIAKNIKEMNCHQIQPGNSNKPISGPIKAPHTPTMGYSDGLLSETHFPIDSKTSSKVKGKK